MERDLKAELQSSPYVVLIVLPNSSYKDRNKCIYTNLQSLHCSLLGQVFVQSKSKFRNNRTNFYTIDYKAFFVDLG